jgi:hypothetical protein
MIEVPPTNRLPWTDARRIALILLLTISIHAYMVVNTTVVSRDCTIFSRYALHLETAPLDPLDPTQTKTLAAPWEVIKKAEHPPAYPASILAMSKLVHGFMRGPSPHSMAISAQLVSALAAILLVFPMFGLVRRLFDSKVACAATAIYQVLPVFVEVTIDGISDGLFLLTAVTSLWFATRALEMQFSYGAYFHGLGAGLSCGLGYLIRPDAMIVGVTIGLTYAGAVLIRLSTKGARSSSRLPFWAGIGLSLGVAIIFLPYVQLIGRFTNKPSGNEMLTRLHAIIFGSKEPPKATYFDRNQSRLKTVNLPLAAWWHPIENEKDSRAVWAARELLTKEYPKAAHYWLPCLGFIGMLALRRRFLEARVFMLLLLALIHMTILWVLASGVGYVSQRHTLLTVLVAAIFAAAALPIIGRWFQRGKGDGWTVGTILALLIIASCLPRDFRSLHQDRAGHKEAGLWLAEHADPKASIIDPFGWSEYYAGRTLHQRTQASPYHGPFVYVIVEPNTKSPHTRLPMYEQTHLLKKQGEVIYQYPPDAPAEKVLVQIYKSKPLKP